MQLIAATDNGTEKQNFVHKLIPKENKKKNK